MILNIWFTCVSKDQGDKRCSNTHEVERFAVVTRRAPHASLNAMPRNTAPEPGQVPLNRQLAVQPAQRLSDWQNFTADSTVIFAKGTIWPPSIAPAKQRVGGEGLGGAGAGNAAKFR